MRQSASIFVAVLVSAVAVRATAADSTQQPGPGAPAPVAGAPASPLAAQPLEKLSATLDRPLFSPTRRQPAPPPALPPPPPAAAPDITLLAVIMDGEDARALIRSGSAPKIMRVQIGDDIDGWKVGQIEGKQLLLMLDGRTAKFSMFTGNSANARPSGAVPVTPPSGGGPPQNQAQSSPPASSNTGQPAGAQAPAAAFTHARRAHR
jgi:general secretion pathway protein N